ncbi:MAG: hypothetical protein GDA56_15290 [Hormoscilla sp. GM7CHS1pb]|nr:hypothetical protein [Hormoscilla sp. GM7CHS1pb]
MPNTQTSTNREKRSVKIILVGVPQAVIYVINVLQAIELAWLRHAARSGW